MKIQLLRPDAKTRDFAEIGEVNSAQELVDFYNHFDWASLEKTITLRQQQDLPSFPVILRFERSSTDYVELTESKEATVFINCVKDESVLETVISRDLNESKFSIEEFLSDFWNKSHKDKYAFEQFSNDNSNQAFRAKFPIRLLWPLIFPIGFSAIFFLTDKNLTLDIVALVLGIPLALTIPYFLLLYNYYSIDRTTAIEIENRGNALIIHKHGIPRTVKRAEITQAKIYRSESEKLLIYGWGYLLLDIGPKDRIVITSFVSEDLESIASAFGIQYAVVPTFYPWIRLRLKTDSEIIEEAESFKKKQAEFVSRWQNKSPEELQKIIAGKSEYAEYAVEAAKSILKDKYGL